jgi:hypothetical protein
MKRHLCKIAAASALAFAGIGFSSQPANAAPAGKCEITRLGNTTGQAECTGPVTVKRIYADCSFESDPGFSNVVINANSTLRFSFECTFGINGISWSYA